MKQINVKILENKRIAPDFYKMEIESPYLAKTAKPGQFLEVLCSKNTAPLLRRPFGIHRISRRCVTILYETVGEGTELLSRCAKGECLDVIGPLGNGFDASLSGRTAMLVAGGIGVAPLLALAERLAYSVQRTAYRKKRKVYVLIGARSKSHIICESEFKRLGCKVLVSTEDGSKGHKGLVTDMLKNLSSISRDVATIYACGPIGMLKAVSQIAKEKQISCQVSLEERMACGVGVCLGCPVKVRKELIDFEYKMVCKDGPVFNAEEIMW